MREKGVSEVVGTLLIMLVISATVAVLYVSSHPLIFKSKENIKYRNAYFDLLDLKDKLDRIRFGIEPNASIALSLAGTSASFKNEAVITINSTNYNVSSISYAGNGWELVFEDGAIIERRGDKARMLLAPSVYLAGNTLNMPIISFTSTVFAGGRGIETFTATLENVSLLKQGPAIIKINTRNADAWKDYFDSIGLAYLASGNEITIVSDSYIVLYEVRLK
jgi:hypothetical protein